MSESERRCRGYVFTVNNWNEESLINFASLFEIGYANYLVMGLEVAPTTGTPHIQGYIHFPEAHSMDTVHRKLEWCWRNMPSGFEIILDHGILIDVHIEIPKKPSFKEARAKGDRTFRRWEYCKKDGDYLEFGIPPEDGVNTTTHKVVCSINQGLSYDELVEAYPGYMLRNSRHVQSCLAEKLERECRGIKTTFMAMDIKLLDSKEDYLMNVIPDYFSDSSIVVDNLTMIDPTKYYDTVYYFVDSMVIFNVKYKNTLYMTWMRNNRVVYKYGYENRTVNCDNFVFIITGSHNYDVFIKSYKVEDIMSQLYIDDSDDELLLPDSVDFISDDDSDVITI